MLHHISQPFSKETTVLYFWNLCRLLGRDTLLVFHHLEHNLAARLNHLALMPHDGKAITTYIL